LEVDAVVRVVLTHEGRFERSLVGRAMARPASFPATRQVDRLRFACRAGQSSGDEHNQQWTHEQLAQHDSLLERNAVRRGFATYTATYRQERGTTLRRPQRGAAVANVRLQSC